MSKGKSRRRKAVFKRVKARKMVDLRAKDLRDAQRKLQRQMYETQRRQNVSDYLSYRRHRADAKAAHYKTRPKKTPIPPPADRTRSYDWNEHYRRYREANKTSGASRAARSARSKTVPPKTRKTTATSAGKTPYMFALLNARRKYMCNFWTGDPCVTRPNSHLAGKIRQSGKGGGYSPRKWC